MRNPLYNEIKAGEQFKLKPNSRIVWLMFGGYAMNGERTELLAVRTDSHMGTTLLKWMAEGSDTAKRPCSAQEVHKVSTTFYADDFASAVRAA